MSNIRASRTISFATPRLSAATGCGFGALALALVAIWTFDMVLFRGQRWHVTHLDAFFWLVAAGSAALAVIVPDKAISVPAYRFLQGACGSIMGFLALAFTPAFGVVHADIYGAVEPLFSVGRWVAVAGAVLSLWRPMLAIVPCAYLIIAKAAIRRITDMPVAETDYIVVAEIGLFLSFGAAAMAAIRAMMPKTTAEGIERPGLLLLLMCGFGIHFSNYFLSGWAKVELDGGPLSWVLENRTQDLVLAGHYIGTLPLDLVGDLGWLGYAALGPVVAASNAIVLLAQLGTVLFITRVRWIIAATLFFDLMHIGIALLTGVNFWIWVLLNLCIVASCVRLRGERIPVYARVVPVAFVLFSWTLFHIARLGWYDSPAPTDIYLEAETDTGTFRVPTNYFLANSYAFYHRAVIGAAFKGHYDTGPWGSTWRRQKVLDARMCKPLPQAPAVVDGPVLDRVSAYVKAHHRYVLAHVDAAGRINYDLYPHHHFSLPARYRAFHDLDKRRINSYLYVMETVCLSHEDGRYARRVLRRDVARINVR